MKPIFEIFSNNPGWGGGGGGERRRVRPNFSISEINADNKLLNGDKDIANALSKHFIQIGKILATK